jgi:GDP-4-dehydro-6-deoxy-D-mannose reductase
MRLRVLITGATGFVGRRLVEHAARRGHAVAAMANDATPPPEGVEKLCVDVRDRAAVGAAVAAFAPRRIVHLAALSHVGESWRRIPETFAINVLGAEHVLEAAPSGTEVLFMSSAEVYGLVPDDEQPIVEERPAAPRTPYALSKAAAERLMLRAGATVIGSFNLIGAGQAPTFALPDFARQLAGIAAGQS